MQISKIFNLYIHNIIILIQKDKTNFLMRKSKKIIKVSFKNSQVDYVKALRRSGKEDLLKHIGDGSEIIDFL